MKRNVSLKRKKKMQQNKNPQCCFERQSSSEQNSVPCRCSADSAESALLIKEEAPEEWSSSVDQKDPETLTLKAEEEELRTSLDVEQLGVKETDDTKFSFTAVPLKSEDDEEKPLFSQLHQHQVEDGDLPTSSSADQMKAATGGEDCVQLYRSGLDPRIIEPSKIAMASSKPARLKVILGKNNIEKLTFPNGIPDSLNELLSKVKETFGLKTNIRLQYMDKDFDNDFFNLNSTKDIEDLGTIKVIEQQSIESLIDVIETVSPFSTINSDESSSLASDDPIILSFLESSSSRTQQWPAIFPIPLFSYDTERQLEKGNSEYKANNKMLKVTFRMKTDILNRVAEEIYKYRAYPDDAHFCLVAEALIKKHPCLKEPGFFNGCYGWKQRLKYKMANYRFLLKSQGCAEVSVNTLKSKASTGSYVSPAAKIKKPRRAEANFYPSFPLGETRESMEKERLELLTAIKRRNNDQVIADKMAWTFAYRRQEVVNEEPGIEDFKNRWPALFQQKEINAEFQRLVTLPLEQTFMAQLDRHSSQLIKVILAKGGATHAKTAGIMKTYDEVEDIDIRRECVLKGLITFVGEDAEDLIKEYCGISGDDAQMELKHLTMAVFVIRKEGERLKEPPEDIGIVIEGVMVLHDLTSVASACALLLGLIYVLNLAYPKTLRFTFEVFQKIFMQLEQHKMSYKVHNLFGRLQSSQ